MKEKIKLVIVFILGIMISVVISVYAATVISANEVSYTDNKGIGASNVQDAINGTYTAANNIASRVTTLETKGPSVLTSANETYHVNMQNDGNLVLYDSSNTPLWSTNSHKIIIQDYTYDSQAIASSGTTLSYTLPTYCNESGIISAFIKRAWPKSNWTNGALVTLNEVTASTFKLTTTSAQNYSIVIRIACTKR